MAQVTTTTNTISFTLNLARSGDTNKRTLSFDVDSAVEATALETAATNWLTNFNKLIQPTQWRDADAAEEEWTTIGITPTQTTKTVTTYDPIESGGGE